MGTPDCHGSPARLPEVQEPVLGQATAQGRGCFDHATLFRDLWSVTRDGERGIDAVRRLEKGVAA